MTADVRQVCKEMDDLSLRMLELMDEQLQNNMRTEQMMKYGFIDIAKARYIMGNRNLSSLQLPGENSPEFTALSTVTLSPHEDEAHSKFVLHTVPKTKPKVESKDEDSTVRKRGMSEEKGVEVISEGPSRIVDPIKWFGVLVPQNLRKAQTSFTTSIELLTQSANIQLELESTLNKYNKLRGSKTCRDKKATENIAHEVSTKEVTDKIKTSSKKNKNKSQK